MFDSDFNAIFRLLNRLTDGYFRKNEGAKTGVDQEAFAGKTATEVNRVAERATAESQKLRGKENQFQSALLSNAFSGAAKDTPSEIVSRLFNSISGEVVDAARKPKPAADVATTEEVSHRSWLIAQAELSQEKAKNPDMTVVEEFSLFLKLYKEKLKEESDALKVQQKAKSASNPGQAAQIRKTLIELYDPTANPLLKSAETLSRLAAEAQKMETDDKLKPIYRHNKLKRDAKNLLSLVAPPLPAGTQGPLPAPPIDVTPIDKAINDAKAIKVPQKNAQGHDVLVDGPVPPGLQRLKENIDVVNKTLADLHGSPGTPGIYERTNNPGQNEELLKALQTIAEKTNQIAFALDETASRSLLLANNMLTEQQLRDLRAECQKVSSGMDFGDHLAMPKNYRRAPDAGKSAASTINVQVMGKTCDISYKEWVEGPEGNKWIKRDMNDLRAKLKNLGPGENPTVADMANTVDRINLENQKKFGASWKPVTLKDLGGGKYRVDASYAKTPNAKNYYEKHHDPKGSFDEGLAYFWTELDKTIGERKATATAAVTTGNISATQPPAAPPTGTQRPLQPPSPAASQPATDPAALQSPGSPTGQRNFDDEVSESDIDEPFGTHASGATSNTGVGPRNPNDRERDDGPVGNTR